MTPQEKRVTILIKNWNPVKQKVDELEKLLCRCEDDTTRPGNPYFKEIVNHEVHNIGSDLNELIDECNEVIATDFEGNVLLLYGVELNPDGYPYTRNNDKVYAIQDAVELYGWLEEQAHREHR